MYPVSYAEPSGSINPKSTAPTIAGPSLYIGDVSFHGGSGQDFGFGGLSELGLGTRLPPRGRRYDKKTHPKTHMYLDILMGPEGYSGALFH